jgi:hypothetical protein
MTSYPECDRLNAVSSEVSTLSEFLEWIQSDGLVLCRLDDTGKICMDANVFEYFATHESAQDLIYRFFAIDPGKLDRERRAILDELRALDMG